MRAWLLATALAIASHPALAQETDPSRDALIARAKSLELGTAYVPPPGDPLAHHAAGFAKVMCSAVFITRLQPDFAAENVGYFTAPYAERAKMGKPVIDYGQKAVHIPLANGVQRTAVFLGDQGCVTLPIGQRSVSYTPIPIMRRSDPTQPWPTGDVLPTALPALLDAVKVRQAIEQPSNPATP